MVRGRGGVGGMCVGVGLSTALMPRLGVRAISGIVFFGAATGLFLSSLLSAHSSYVGGMLPGMVLMGVFIGVIMPALVNAALHERAGEASLGSAGRNVMR